MRARIAPISAIWCVKIEVVEAGERKWVAPEWMEFSYRDSRLRATGGEPAALIAVTLQLTPAAATESA